MVSPEAANVSVELHGLRLPLAPFTLEATACLAGRVTGLFGASGSGKTSLLEIIAGLRRPAAGRVSLDGTVLTDLAANVFLRPEHRAVGYVPQEGALFPHLSVRRNLLYGRKTAAVGNPGLTLDHVAEILEITQLLPRRIASLSGGEKQRVALGRALLASPRLLLLDEPLSGLDQPLRERLLPYLARVRDEFAIPMIYVTHSPDEIMSLCDEVVVMARGRIERQGPPSELFVRSDTPHFRLRTSS
jgi:molybdate transport system ATP-binding protein